jgi:ribosomal protein S18 acetylase RimI-like enzyme
MGNKAEIEVRSAGSLPQAELTQIDDIDRQAFSDDPYRGMEWSPVHWHVLAKLNDVWVSCVGIVERTGTVHGQPVKLGGIGGVATLPTYRRRGLAEAALRKAQAFMRDQLRVEFGLLICNQQMIPYYRKLGWQVVEGPLVFQQPQGPVIFEDVTMILPGIRQEWPPGVIDLGGPPW